MSGYKLKLMFCIQSKKSKITLTWRSFSNHR